MPLSEFACNARSAIYRAGGDAVRNIRAELDLTMGLPGCTTRGEVRRDRLSPAAYGPEVVRPGRR